MDTSQKGILALQSKKKLSPVRLREGKEDTMDTYLIIFTDNGCLEAASITWA